MTSYILVKIFDLSTAPPELQSAIESQMLRPHDGNSDPALLAVWVGTRTSSLERPTEASDTSKVTAWEHSLHRWLRQSGAIAGDVVLLNWGSPPGASVPQPVLQANGSVTYDTPPTSALLARSLLSLARKPMLH